MGVGYLPLLTKHTDEKHSCIGAKRGADPGDNSPTKIENNSPQGYDILRKIEIDKVIANLKLNGYEHNCSYLKT